MTEALALTDDRSRRRLDDRETARFRKQGYAHTDEFAAALKDGDLITRLASHITNSPEADDFGLRGIDADILALAGIASLLNSIASGIEEPERTLDIGRNIQSEKWRAGLLPSERRKLNRAIKRDASARYRAAKRLDYDVNGWSLRQRQLVGAWFLDCCVTALPEVFVKIDQENKRYPSKPITSVGILDSWRERLDSIQDKLVHAHPSYVPSRDRLDPWTGFRTGGGYWDKDSPYAATFVKTPYAETKREVSTAFKRGGMKQHVRAVNALRDVPWRINERVLEQVKLHAERIVIDDLTKALTKKHERILERKIKWAEEHDQPADWIAREKDRLARAAEKEISTSIKGRRTTVRGDIQTADRYRGAPFYLPMNCNSRGRISPIPHFNFQREDHVRALFLFDRGLPIETEYAEECLVGSVADLYGVAGKSDIDRELWFYQNTDLIKRVALGLTDEWQKAEKPFAFLAACIELKAFSEHGLGFVTHLPVSFDATCSGLQHICAIMRDDVNAPLVNLCNTHGHALCKSSVNGRCRRLALPSTRPWPQCPASMSMQ